MSLRLNEQAHRTLCQVEAAKERYRKEKEIPAFKASARVQSSCPCMSAKHSVLREHTLSPIEPTHSQPHFTECPYDNVHIVVASSPVEMDDSKSENLGVEPCSGHTDELTKTYHTLLCRLKTRPKLHAPRV
jgi:hypothetical protein